MAEVPLTAITSVDGVVQAPGGPNEDASGGVAHGGWLLPLADADMGACMVEIFATADPFALRCRRGWLPPRGGSICLRAERLAETANALRALGGDLE